MGACFSGLPMGDGLFPTRESEELRFFKAEPKDNKQRKSYSG